MRITEKKSKELTAMFKDGELESLQDVADYLGVDVDEI